MLTFQYALTAAALLVAVAALFKSRQAARRLERLAESYWELRYEYGQLRARVDRLEGAANPDAEMSSQSAAAGPATFIPLSSLKK